MTEPPELGGATVTLLHTDATLDLGLNRVDGAAVFDRASEAVACALVLRREHADLRIGLHTGELGGPGSAAAERCRQLCAAAHPGQTLLSGVTFDLVADGPPEGAVFVDLGELLLPGMRRPGRVWQLGDGVFPTLGTPPTNLPSQLTSFIGREPEIADLLERVPHARLLTLTGAGGCGKTRLAVQVAGLLRDRYPAGVWFCDLGPLSRTELVVGALADALGLGDQLGAQPVDVVVARLAKARALVVLDNCEHVVGACASLAEQLLRGCPELTVVATSREPLGAEGEVAWRVPSMALPAAGADYEADELVAFDAVRLFVERARTRRPNFGVDAGNVAAVVTLCERLDGIPLAIELAASRVRVLSVEQIATGLDDRFHLLGAGVRSSLPRQQTLQASVDWSHELLTEPERVLLRRLAVFNGGFDLDAAEAVCSGDGLDRLSVLDLLSQLVDKSLVFLAERDADARYRLLETVRYDALRRLVDAGEATVLRERHRDHYAALAVAGHEALMRGEADDSALAAWCVREAENLRDALRLTMAGEDTALKLRFARSLEQVWWRKRGTYREAVGWYEQALADPGGPDDLRSSCWARLSFHQARLGDLDRALVSAETAVSLAPATGEQACESLWVLAIAASNGGHKERAREAVRRVTLAVDGIPLDQLTDPLTFALLGHDALFDGDNERGGRLLRMGLALAGRLGHHELRASLHYWLGCLDFGEGRFALAQAELTEAYTVALGGWSEEMENQALLALSHFAARRGDYDRAYAIVADRLASTDDIGLWPSFMRSELARVCWARGDLVEAREHLASAFIRVGHHRLDHALLALAEGAVEEARAALDEVDDSDDSVMPFALCVRGWVERAEGDLGASEATHHESIGAWHPTSVQFPYVDTVIENVEALAGIAAVTGRALEAARLFGAVEALRVEAEAPRHPVRRAGYDADVACAREALGADELETAWAAGAGMSVDEVVAYARRGRGHQRRATAGWDALTPAETEVVRLAARGLTNPEIAERLFVARSTVKVHLSHVFAKLGCSTRAELAAEAARRGV
jgi:predicted ATPase/DNA-binding CsgD family transcriptional regulator